MNPLEILLYVVFVNFCCSGDAPIMTPRTAIQIQYERSSTTEISLQGAGWNVISSSGFLFKGHVTEGAAALLVVDFIQSFVSQGSQKQILADKQTRTHHSAYPIRECKGFTESFGLNGYHHLLESPASLLSTWLCHEWLVATDNWAIRCRSSDRILGANVVATSMSHFGAEISHYSVQLASVYFVYYYLVLDCVYLYRLTRNVRWNGIHGLYGTQSQRFRILGYDGGCITIVFHIDLVSQVKGHVVSIVENLRSEPPGSI